MTLYLKNERYFLHNKDKIRNIECDIYFEIELN